MITVFKWHLLILVLTLMLCIKIWLWLIHLWHSCCIIALPVSKYKDCYLLVWKYRNVRSSSSKLVKTSLMLIVLAWIYIMTGMFIQYFCSLDTHASWAPKNGRKQSGFIPPTGNKATTQLRPVSIWVTLRLHRQASVYRHSCTECLFKKNPKQNKTQS